MRYLLKTELNSNRNEVFCKERRGKSFVYFAEAENGKVGVVDKAWVIKNAADILNLGVCKNGAIYPVLSKSFNITKKKSLISFYEFNNTRNLKVIGVATMPHFPNEENMVLIDFYIGGDDYAPAFAFGAYEDIPFTQSAVDKFVYRECTENFDYLFQHHGFRLEEEFALEQYRAYKATQK